MIIETARPGLRPLTDADMEPYFAMAADRAVKRYVSPTPTPIPRADAEAAATPVLHLPESFFCRTYNSTRLSLPPSK